MNTLFSTPSAFAIPMDADSNDFKVALPCPPESIDELLSKYCLCEVCVWEISSQATSEQLATSNETAHLKHVPFRKNSLYISRYRFDLKAAALHQYLLASPLRGDEVFKRAGSKAAPKRGSRCLTRSNYIGVSRNGSRWQSLINVRNHKTYIASYHEERDAAVSFDLHSIMLHGSKSKTNFSYTKDELLDMVIRYQTNNYIL